MQRTAAHLHCEARKLIVGLVLQPLQHCNTLQHAATRSNTLQHTAATRCNTLQHTAAHYNTLHYTATHLHCEARELIVGLVLQSLLTHVVYRWAAHWLLQVCCKCVADELQVCCSVLQHVAVTHAKSPLLTHVVYRWAAHWLLQVCCRCVAGVL